jgi:hypothetical protein
MTTMRAIGDRMNLREGARLIVHMPECIAIIGGDRPEGYQWLGVCRIFAVEHWREGARRASRLSLTHALESIGPDLPMRRSAPRMTESMLSGHW